MPARPVPRRHWRSYGDDPLPSGKEALDEPFSAFPSWFLRIECDCCGKFVGAPFCVRLVSKRSRDMPSDKAISTSFERDFRGFPAIAICPL